MPQLKAKDAVALAKSYLNELLSEEGLYNVGLEELEFDEGHGTWEVTLGFSRPWDRPSGPLSTFERDPRSRDYRRITVADHSGEVTSIKIRSIAAA